MTEQIIDPADPAIGWRAEQYADPRSPDYPWRPLLHTAGSNYPLDVWFRTRDDCEGWIARWVAGRGMGRVSP